MPVSVGVRLAPTQCPDVLLTTGEVALVGPPAHLSRGPKHITDVCEPVGVSLGSAGTLRAALGEIINRMTSLRIDERGSHAARPIPEKRHIFGSAVGVIAVHVKSVVAFKKHMMRTHEVAGVKSYLDPALSVVDES